MVLSQFFLKFQPRTAPVLMASSNVVGSSKAVSAFPTARSVTNKTTAQTDQMNLFIVESTNAQEFRYKTFKANYNKTSN